MKNILAFAALAFGLSSLSQAMNLTDCSQDLNSYLDFKGTGDSTLRGYVIMDGKIKSKTINKKTGKYDDFSNDKNVIYKRINTSYETYNYWTQLGGQKKKMQLKIEKDPKTGAVYALNQEANKKVATTLVKEVVTLTGENMTAEEMGNLSPKQGGDEPPSFAHLSPDQTIGDRYQFQPINGRCVLNLGSSIAVDKKGHRKENFFYSRKYCEAQEKLGQKKPPQKVSDNTAVEVALETKGIPVSYRELEISTNRTIICQGGLPYIKKFRDSHMSMDSISPAESGAEPDVSK